MNSLYTSGVRQTNSLQADLEKLRNGDNSPALLGEFQWSGLMVVDTAGWLTKASHLLHALFHAGQISASLSAMHRTIDDYDSMTKREIIKAKQEKAQMFAIS